MKRGKTKTIKFVIIALSLFSAVVILVVAECVLKSKGYEPGWYYAGFKTVDTPLIIPDKQTTKITPDSFDLVANVYGDYPLNAQGFVSRFNYDSAVLNATPKKKVMIIGDSFTQGAVPFYDSSFVARLIKTLPDKLILNFGVAGTDPLNYKLILRKYIKAVQPSLVIVAFCGDNDEMLSDNRLAQNRFSIMWNTNFCFGGIPTRIPFSAAKRDNEYFPSVDSMYRFYYRQYNLKGARPCFTTNFFSLTRVGTLLGFKLLPPPSVVYYNPSGQRYCHEHIKEMKSLCDSNGVKMIVAYIPSKNDIHYKTAFPYMGPDCYYPEMTEEDYNTNPAADIHWNSEGHKKFALFLAPLIAKYTN